MLVEELADKLVGWLKEQSAAAGTTGLVVGLSGGIDSAVVAALCSRTNPENTLGLIMPCYSDPQDAQYGRLVAETFNIPVEEVVLDEPFQWLVHRFTGQPYDVNNKDLTIANIKPRLRMLTLYHYAARNHALVVGTGNLTEITVGYFTKYGDGGVDLLPIGNLIKKQVRELAKYLGVPQSIIDKAPSAGLWAGHCDEQEMGVTYDQLDQYILYGQGTPEAKHTIQELARRSEHKKVMPLTPPF